MPVSVVLHLSFPHLICTEVQKSGEDAVVITSVAFLIQKRVLVFAEQNSYLHELKKQFSLHIPFFYDITLETDIQLHYQVNKQILSSFLYHHS